jgi:competence ComEA-like helix-hairpin-helix protein
MLPSIILSLIACQTEPTQNIIALEWHQGQTFYVASSQKQIANNNVESAVSLENYDPNDILQESWSEEAIWTYRVIESDFYPDANDQLFEYSLSGTGDQVPLTVIKATIDETLNADETILELDPVVYLVFQSRNNRLAGIVQFTSLDGERMEEAYSTSNINSSWSILSQSNLALAPTYLAPFGVRWTTEERKLENGSSVYSEEVDIGVADVIFDDELGGEIVSARYEEGKPWPVLTVTSNINSRLLEEEEVTDIRGTLPDQRPWLNNQEFDYRNALRESINLERATKLDPEFIESGESLMEANEGYRPWAGAWWPLKKGELIFGYDGNHETYSSLVKEEIDVIKKEMDELSEEIRELGKEEETEEIIKSRKEKKETYSTKQKELVDILIEFYTDFRTDLDGGKITVADGKISKEAIIENVGEDNEEIVEDGWEYDLNSLSPMDKFALVEYLDGQNRQNPFYISAWEILNSYNPGGESWWGHCNGWAAAAILTNEPRETLTIEKDGHSFEFNTADQKGLLTEAHYSTHSHFYGERYNGEDDDIADLTPANFHKLITFYLKEQGVPFVFDTTATEAVWNFPVWKADLTIEEADTSEEKEKLNVNLATLEELTNVEEVGSELATAIIKYRESNGTIQDLEELQQIDGYSANKHDDLLRTDIVEKTYFIDSIVTLTTDSVGNSHVDTDINDPDSMTKRWNYTLTVNEEGTITGGSWDDDSNHPDFAWVPYKNPKRFSDTNSENPYLEYGNLLDHFGDEVNRK